MTTISVPNELADRLRELAARWRVPQAVILRAVLPPALDAWEAERVDVDPTRAAEVLR